MPAEAYFYGIVHRKLTEKIAFALIYVMALLVNARRPRCLDGIGLFLKGLVCSGRFMESQAVLMGSQACPWDSGPMANGHKLCPIPRTTSAV